MLVRPCVVRTRSFASLPQKPRTAEEEAIFLLGMRREYKNIRNVHAKFFGQAKTLAQVVEFYWSKRGLLRRSIRCWLYAQHNGYIWRRIRCCDSVKCCLLYTSPSPRD